MKEQLSSTHLLIILGIFIATFLAISTNLFTPYLWYDEAGQFWISKGLNHDSDPLAHQNGLIEVIESNKYYNLDPGGFGVLLHFWSYISNNHVWLRLLPFLFFIGVVLSFIYLSYLWLKNISIALLMGFVPILTPVVLKMGFEIRAYSMESFATIITVVAIEKLKSKITYKHLFLWSCAFSILMTSRYSEIIVVFVASLYVLFLIFNSNSTLKQKFLSAIIYSVPLITTLLYIYFFALIFQNRNIEPLLYLPYISNDKGLLVAPENVLFLSIIVIFIILYFLKTKYSIIKKYESLLFVAILVNVLFIILSSFGMHPWYPFSHRCISLLLLVILCISAFLGELIKFLAKSKETLIYYFIIAGLILTLYLRNDELFIRLNNNNTYTNFEKIHIEDFNRIFVDRWESPGIRYLFEYGKLKARKGIVYPNNFTFAKGRLHGFNENESFHDFYLRQPKMNELLEYDLLIDPDELRRHKLGINDMWKLIDGTTNFYIKSKANNVNNPHPESNN